MASVRSLFDAQRSRVAFCISTKERVESTRSMLPNLVQEGDYDLLWIDGSRTAEGKALPTELAPTIPRLREIHWDVTGGADVAIVYALCRMCELGYEYCGLIENDIALTPGWFSRLVELFEIGAGDGLRVGAVSARTFARRVLFLRPRYAVLFNCGAAMILLTKEAVRSVLNRYRTTTSAELRSVFLSTTQRDIIPFADFRYGHEDPLKVNCSADWFFDAALYLDGYCSLGLAPSMAVDMDPDIVDVYGELVQAAPAELSPDEESAYAAFRATHARQTDPCQRLQLGSTSLFLRSDNRWLVFPHQALALGGVRLAGDWRIAWENTSGPFSYQAVSTVARMALEFIGPCSLLLASDERSGAIEVMDSGFGYTVDLRRHEPSLTAITFGDNLSASKQEKRRVEFLFRGAGSGAGAEPHIAWRGLYCQEIQPWFSADTGFGISTLRPYVPSLRSRVP